MRHETSVSLEPALHSGVFVRAIVIHDHVQGHVAGKLLIQALQKLQELLMAVTRVTLANDLALRHFQGGKQSRRAVALVVVGHGSATSLLERQSRRSAIQGLNLALFVNTEHQRFLRRVQI